jgi:hypothetical protein
MVVDRDHELVDLHPERLVDPDPPPPANSSRSYLRSSHDRPESTTASAVAMTAPAATTMHAKASAGAVRTQTTSP